MVILIALINGRALRSGYPTKMAAALTHPMNKSEQNDVHIYDRCTQISKFRRCCSAHALKANGLNVYRAAALKLHSISFTSCPVCPTHRLILSYFFHSEVYIQHCMFNIILNNFVLFILREISYLHNHPPHHHPPRPTWNCFCALLPCMLTLIDTFASCCWDTKKIYSLIDRSISNAGNQSIN